MNSYEEDNCEADVNALTREDGRYDNACPNVIEQLVCSVSATSPLDRLCEALDSADWLSARAKSISHLSRQIAIQWIERNGEFHIGDVHYRVGYNHVTRCTQPKQTGLQLLDDLGGDFSSFLDVLVAQPFKPSTAKQILEKSAYSRLFSMKLASRLVAGVPERSLIRSNTRFVGR